MKKLYSTPWLDTLVQFLRSLDQSQGHSKVRYFSI